MARDNGRADEPLIVDGNPLQFIEVWKRVFLEIGVEVLDRPTGTGGKKRRDRFPVSLKPTHHIRFSVSTK